MEGHGLPGFVCPTDTPGPATACTTQSTQGQSTFPHLETPMSSLPPPSSHPPTLPKSSPPASPPASPTASPPPLPQSPSRLDQNGRSFSSSPPSLFNDQHGPPSTFHAPRRDHHSATAATATTTATTPLELAATYTVQPASSPPQSQPPPSSSSWDAPTWPAQEPCDSHPPPLPPPSSYGLPLSLPPSSSQPQSPPTTSYYYPQPWKPSPPTNQGAWGMPADPAGQGGYGPSASYLGSNDAVASSSSNSSHSNTNNSSSLCYGHPDMSPASSWTTQAGASPYEPTIDYRGGDVIQNPDGLPGSHHHLHHHSQHHNPSSYPYPYQFGAGGGPARLGSTGAMQSLYASGVRQPSDYDEAVLGGPAASPMSLGGPCASSACSTSSTCSSSSVAGGALYGRGPAATSVPMSTTGSMMSSRYDDGGMNHTIVNSHDCVDTPASSGSGGAANTSKTDEPYAQLIYRAFMSCPRHAMTLQEIYQWFRENTDKDKYSFDKREKGWQNSIRHNLSMNAAFTKRDRVFSDPDVDMDGQGDVGEDDEGEDDRNEATTDTKNGRREDGTNGGAGNAEPTATAATIKTTTNAKKSTEWVLQDWAIRDGVQSTTRYRNSGRKSGSKPSAASSGATGTGSRCKRLKSTDHQHHHHRRASSRRPSSSSPSRRGTSRARTCLASPGRTPEWQGSCYPPLPLPPHPSLHRSTPKAPFFLQSPLSDPQQQQQHQPRPGSGATGGPEADYAGGYTPTLFLPSVPGAPTVKSEGENDEVITPEASFSFHEPSVLLPELQVVGPGTAGSGASYSSVGISGSGDGSNPYAGELVTVYSGNGGAGGGAGQPDLSGYGLASVGGAVYDEGVLHGCAAPSPHPSYDNNDNTNNSIPCWQGPPGPTAYYHHPSLARGLPMMASAGVKEEAEKEEGQSFLAGDPS